MAGVKQEITDICNQYESGETVEIIEKPMTFNAGQTSKYTDIERRAALSLFVILGNYKQTAKQLNMPRITLMGWTKQNWWIDNIYQVRQEHAAELDVRVSNTMNNALDSLDQRMKAGDPYVNKEGKISFKPVTAKDSSVIYAIMFDKRQIMRVLPTTITHSTGSDKLMKLQETFEKIVEQRTKTIDASVVSEG